MTLLRVMTLCETVEIWTLTCKGGGWFPIDTPIAAALFWADWSSLAGGVWNKEVTLKSGDKSASKVHVTWLINNS